MFRNIQAGATSQSVYLDILDSTSSTGGRLTGLAYNTASLTAYYVRSGGSATAITLATLSTPSSAYSSGGFKEVDATNMPGIYRLDLPNTAIATGAVSVVIMLKGAANMVPVSMCIPLTAFNDQDAVRGGLTALPNANANASNGLPTAGTGTNQISLSGGRAKADVSYWNASAVATPDTAGYPKVTNKSGTGAGELNLSAGMIAANATQIGGTAQSTGDVNAKLNTITGYLDTEVAAILADTNELQTDWANGGRLDNILDARASQTSVDTIDTNVDAILADTADMQPKLGTPAASVSADIAAVKSQADAIKAKTDNLPASPAATSDIPSVASIADGVWDEATSGHTTAGTTGKALTDAGSAGDPLASAVPGGYSAGTAGYILGHNLDAAVSGRASQTSVDTIDTNVDAILADTADMQPKLGTPAVSVSADIADVESKVDDLEGRLTATRAGYLDNLSGGAVATQSSVNTIDTNVDAILVDTGTTLDGKINTISTKVSANEATINTVDSTTTAIKAKTDNLPGDPADASVVAGLIAPIDDMVGDLYLIAGLDAANPMTITPSARSAGTVSLALTGDGRTSKTVTRNP